MSSLLQLSPHFSLEELVYSSVALRHGIDNTPPPEAIENMTRLCIDILEPTRALLGCVMHSDSGFRCPQLNLLVGSTASHSDHLDGNADDFFPIGIPLREAFDKIRQSDIPFKRVIIECNAWIHIARQGDGQKPFREALIASGGPGRWTYERAA